MRPVMEKTVILPMELTADNGAKSLLSGDFFETIEHECEECADRASSDGCEYCSGTGYVLQKVQVSWTTIKSIYAKIVENAALLSCVIWLVVFFPLVAMSGHDNPEKFYQQQWCSGTGQAEVVMADRTRIDCLTATHAVEVDFAVKFYEAIGQSLYYSMQTGKRAGIVLIIEKKKDRKYWLRLNSVIRHFGLPIDTWAVGTGV